MGANRVLLAAVLAASLAGACGGSDEETSFTNEEIEAANELKDEIDAFEEDVAAMPACADLGGMSVDEVVEENCRAEDGAPDLTQTWTCDDDSELVYLISGDLAFVGRAGGEFDVAPEAPGTPADDDSAAQFKIGQLEQMCLNY